MPSRPSKDGQQRADVEQLPRAESGRRKAVKWQAWAGSIVPAWIGELARIGADRTEVKALLTLDARGRATLTLRTEQCGAVVAVVGMEERRGIRNPVEAWDWGRRTAWRIFTQKRKVLDEPGAIFIDRTMQSMIAPAIPVDGPDGKSSIRSMLADQLSDHSGESTPKIGAISTARQFVKPFVGQSVRENVPHATGKPHGVPAAMPRSGAPRGRLRVNSAQKYSGQESAQEQPAHGEENRSVEAAVNYTNSQPPSFDYTLHILYDVTIIHLDSSALS